MKFFPQGWLGDMEIRGLSFELQGVLVHLYALAGSQRRFANDPVQLCRQLGVTRPRLERYLTELQAFYLRRDEVVIELKPLDAFRSPVREPEE